MAVVEVHVALDEVPVGGMTQAGSGEHKVLFVRDGYGVRAFQANCPHYGAPLAKGLICGTTLYCPWHKAAFDIGDGSLLEPPALEPLERYPVRIEGSQAVATLEPMAAPVPDDLMADKTFVIVGTGAAAVAAVKTLRSEGFSGKIVMIGREDGQPYDRPKLSKTFLAKKTPRDAMRLETEFFRSHGVEAIDGPATKVEPAERSVTLGDGRTITGDALLIATGSRAKIPAFPGKDLDRVFSLRSLADAEAISEAADGAKRVIVIGNGFIGLEAAAFLTKRGLEATVVAPEALPLAARFGDDVARAIKSYHEGCGIRFVTGEIAAIAGETHATGVRLKDGRALDADIVLIGAGAAPETAIVAGIEPLESGGLEVDAYLKIAPNVWAAGDIAAFREHRSGALARIEHWRLAEQHGIHAALAMLGAEEPFVAAPFFWSNQGDKRLDYVGYAPDYEATVTRGDVAALDFITYYLRGGKAVAACAIGQNPQVIGFLHLLDAGRVPDANDLATADLAALAR